MLLKSNFFSANLLGVGGGDLKASESSLPVLGPVLATLWLGTLVGAEAEGGIVREAPTAAGWRLGGLNSFTALGRSLNGRLAPPWQWPE